MLRVFRHYVSAHNLVLALIDALILMISVYAGLFIRWADFSNPFREIQEHLLHAIVFVLVISLMMIAVGLYEKQIWRNWATIFARIIVGFSIATVFLSLVFYFFPTTSIWRSALVIAVVLALSASLAVRLIYYRVADLETFKRRIVVLGAGERAGRIEALALDDSAPTFFHSVGYIPVNGSRKGVPAGRLIKGVNNLADYVRREGIEEVVVAVDEQRGNLPVQALLECKFEGIAVTDFLSFIERETGRVDLQSLNPSWIIFSGSQTTRSPYPLVKRAFDLIVSSAFLVFILPVMAATAIAIRLESPGPVLYRQERVGYGGKRFQLLKFRSMRVDAESDGVPQWAGRDDPRVTRVGAFIRRTRIDELPQVVNVLKGDMSLVGPRPERPFFVEELCRKIPFYAERHRLKPGLTGWAQINYQYAATVEDTQAKTEFDLYYVKNQSLFLDLVIVLQTLRVILWPPGVH